MTVRKITIDISVKIIAHNEQTREKDSKPNTTFPRKQNKKLSQNN